MSKKSSLRVIQKMPLGNIYYTRPTKTPLTKKMHKGKFNGY